jgi:hypothetical protein
MTLPKGLLARHCPRVRRWDENIPDRGGATYLIQPVDFSLQLATSSASLLPLIPPICLVLLNPLFRATRIPVTGKIVRRSAEVQP